MNGREDTDPPVFLPRGTRRRPSREGAKIVGGKESAEAPVYPVFPESGENGVRDPSYSANFAPRSFPPEMRGKTHGEMHAPGTPAAFSPEGRENNRGIRRALAGKKRHPGRKILGTVIFLLLLAVGWCVYLYWLGSTSLGHTAALSDAPDTAGETYLIVGSDKRGTAVADGTPNERSDSIMLLHKADNGKVTLLSLPRDSYVEIPGHRKNKINSSFAAGGPMLLVQTVEKLTGMKIDHYLQIGMDGVVALTDAVGGINLCYGRDVNDPYSGMNWKAGCHDTDGKGALAFSRMRYKDPLGDIGRTQRQQQVISAILRKAVSPRMFLNPPGQRRLVLAGAEILTVDTNDSLRTVLNAGLTLKEALGPQGQIGTPPISSLSYFPGGVGSTVRLDPNTIERFWADLAKGEATPEKYKTLTVRARH